MEKKYLDDTGLSNLLENLADRINAQASSIYGNLNGKFSNYLPLNGGMLNGSLYTCNIIPVSTDAYDLGTTGVKWNNVYATTFIGNLTGNVSGSATQVSNSLTCGTKTYNGSQAVEIVAADLGLSSALKYIGISDTPLTDKDTTPEIYISGEPVMVSNGDVVFYEDKEFVWNGSKWELLGAELTYKVIQNAVPDPEPAPDESALTFISNIEQDANGVISPTKKSVQAATATQAGIVTTDEQTFSGDKIFINRIYMDVNKYTSIYSGSSSCLDLDSSLSIRFNIKGTTRLLVYANTLRAYLRPNFPTDSNLPVSLGYTTYYFTATYTKDLYLYPISTPNTFYIAGFTTRPNENQTASGRLYASSQIKVINGNSYTDACIQAPGGFYEASDARMKNFSTTITCDLDKLSQLPKKYFTWKSDTTNKLHIGTSAQAVQEIYPELVSEDENGTLSVSYDKLSVVALAAVDKLHEEVKALKNKNQELEDRISKLENLLLYGKDR